MLLRTVKVTENREVRRTAAAQRRLRGQEDSAQCGVVTESQGPKTTWGHS